MAERDLTTGSVPGLMIRLALPVLGGFILQSAYALVDLYWVGRLGSASVAGVGIVLNTFFIVLALGMIVGVGALALLSRAYGAGNREGIPALFQQVFWLSWGIGAAACLGALATAATFMEIFTNDPLVYSEGLAYFRIYAFSFLLQPVLMSLGFCWRAIGDFFTPPLLMGISVATNMALDPLLIFGWGPFPELGIRGASLATVISQIIPLAVYLWLVLGRVRNTLLVLNRPLKLDFGIIRRILRIGLPSGLQFVVVSLSLMLMFRGVKSFGGEAAAAMGIGFRLRQAGILPVVAIGAAVSSMMGQNLGAGFAPRMRATVLWGMLYALLITGLGYGLLLAFPWYWMGLFTDSDGVLAYGVTYLTIFGLSLPLHGLGYVVTSTAQGLGRTMYPLLGQLVSLGVFALGLLLLGLLDWRSVQGVVWAMLSGSAAEFIMLAAVLAMFWRTALKTAPAGSAGR